MGWACIGVVVEAGVDGLGLRAGTTRIFARIHGWMDARMGWAPIRVFVESFVDGPFSVGRGFFPMEQSLLSGAPEGRGSSSAVGAYRDEGPISRRRICFGGRWRGLDTVLRGVYPEPAEGLQTYRAANSGHRSTDVRFLVKMARARNPVFPVRRRLWSLSKVARQPQIMCEHQKPGF